jgi:hypothetical protein
MTSNHTFFQRAAALWRANFLSPKDLVRRAVVITLLFSIAHVAGLKEFTSVLNGTPGSVELGWRTTAFLGVTYIVAYLGLVLLVPVLLLAASFLLIWKSFAQRRATMSGSSSRKFQTHEPETASPDPIPDRALHSGSHP